MSWFIILLVAWIVAAASIWKMIIDLNTMNHMKGWVGRFTRKPNRFRFTADVDTVIINPFANFDQPSAVSDSIQKIPIDLTKDPALIHWKLVTRHLIHKPSSLPPEICLLIVSHDPIQWLGVSKTWQTIVNNYMAVRSYEMCHQLGYHERINLHPRLGLKERGKGEKVMFETLLVLISNRNYKLLQLILKTHELYFATYFRGNIKDGLWSVCRDQASVIWFSDSYKDDHRIFININQFHPIDMINERLLELKTALFGDPDVPHTFNYPGWIASYDVIPLINRESSTFS